MQSTTVRAAAFAIVLCLYSVPSQAWWGNGHGILTQAAVLAQPQEVPAFFRNGAAQVAHMSFDPDIAKEPHDLAEAMRTEWVIGIRGRVRSRGVQLSRKTGSMVSAANPKLASGEVEIEVLEATVFNKSETPPFELTDELSPGVIKCDIPFLYVLMPMRVS